MCSPCLADCYFFLSPDVKDQLRGLRFESEEAIVKICDLPKQTRQRQTLCVYTLDKYSGETGEGLSSPRLYVHFFIHMMVARKKNS